MTASVVMAGANWIREPGKPYPQTYAAAFDRSAAHSRERNMVTLTNNLSCRAPITPETKFLVR